MLPEAVRFKRSKLPTCSCRSEACVVHAVVLSSQVHVVYKNPEALYSLAHLITPVKEH